MKFIILLLIATTLAGCDRKQPVPAKGPSQERSGSVVIDGITGRSAVKAGQRARKAVEAASAAERQNLQEVIGD